LRKIWLRQKWAYPIIVVFVAAAYWPTFTGGFILDDNPLIKDNSYIKEPHSISSYLSQEDGIIDRQGQGTFHSGYYRPLINLIYRMDYQLWGMNATGFRVTNFILHILSCLLLFQLIQLFIDNRQAAFWVTFLFALHPVNTESVSWIISRNNILVTLFILLSFYCYIIWWKKNNYIAWIISIITFFCALLSKEFGVMVLPLFFLYHRFLSGQKEEILRELSSYLPFIGALVLYFFLRKNVTGAFLTPFDMADLLSSIYFIPYLILYNLKLIFVPYRLHFFYLDYPSSPFQWQPILSIGLFMLLAIIFYIYRSNKILLFSGLSFLAFILPILNIVPSASSLVTLVAMRWLYLPMAFICFAIALVIKKALSRRRALTLSILIVFISYLGVYTYILNRNLWHNNATFFQQEVLGFNNDLLVGDLAEVLRDKGDYERAEKYFKIALNKYPFQVYHYINYAALLIDTGRPQSAITWLREAKSLSMTSRQLGEWCNNMGAALIKMEEKGEGLKYFRKAVIYAPDKPMFWANLGGAYGMLDDYENSINALKKGLEITPDSVQLRTNLAQSYMNIKDYQKALSALEGLPEKERKENGEVLRLLKLAREVLQSQDTDLEY
jgi:tetratricopeptide (TPR) repeat protein